MIKYLQVDVVYNLKDENEAMFIYRALVPEFKKGFPGIKSSYIDLKGKEIRFHLQGESVSRIRAIINTLTRWLISIESLNDTIGR
ncbi:MAG TPA: KEOPS complex subunit Pcc1 [Geobacterales bacterium]|nr:KEOPS complex subunit Pcc1 [Geobacterales bacterium]